MKTGGGIVVSVFLFYVRSETLFCVVPRRREEVIRSEKAKVKSENFASIATLAFIE